MFFHSQIIKFEKHVSNESGVPNWLIANVNSWLFWLIFWFLKSQLFRIDSWESIALRVVNLCFMTHNSMFCVFLIPDFSESKKSAKKVRNWFCKSKSYAWLFHLKEVFRTYFPYHFIPSNDRPLDKSFLLSAGISFPYQVFRKSSDTWEAARL